MEEPDYMLRLEGFTEANCLIKQMVTMETDVCLAMIYNCCYFITAVSSRLHFTHNLQDPMCSQRAVGSYSDW